MLAPIALYPDPLLSQILMAATYPLEVVQAARWSSANPMLKGDAAVHAVGSQNWDSSVKSLVAFPQVLQTMDQKIDWTERLGDAFLAQQSQVMDTIQKLRQKAREAGNLSSNSQINVTQPDDSIEVEAANPDMDICAVLRSRSGLRILVVAGLSACVLGAMGGLWLEWRIRVGHRYRHRRRFLFRVVGLAQPTAFTLTTLDILAMVMPWQHDPGHRHGVPYRDVSLNQQFGRVPQHLRRAQSFVAMQPPVNARPDESLAIAYRREPARRARLPETRETMAPRGVSPPFVEPRAHAFENVGRGADVRSFSARGNASMSGRSSAPASSRPSRPSRSIASLKFPVQWAAEHPHHHTRQMECENATINDLNMQCKWKGTGSEYFANNILSHEHMPAHRANHHLRIGTGIHRADRSPSRLRRNNPLNRRRLLSPH